MSWKEQGAHLIYPKTLNYAMCAIYIGLRKIEQNSTNSNKLALNKQTNIVSGIRHASRFHFSGFVDLICRPNRGNRIPPPLPPSYYVYTYVTSRSADVMDQSNFIHYLKLNIYSPYILYKYRPRESARKSFRGRHVWFTDWIRRIAYRSYTRLKCCRRKVISFWLS